VPELALVRMEYDCRKEHARLKGVLGDEMVSGKLKIDLVYANRQRQLIEEVVPACSHAEELDDPDLDLDPMLYVLLLELAFLAHWPYVVVEVVPCPVHWLDVVTG
jgi:hypothetical protein